MQKKKVNKEKSARYRENAIKFWEKQNEKRAQKIAPEFEKILMKSALEGRTPKETSVIVAKHFYQLFKNIRRK